MAPQTCFCGECPTCAHRERQRRYEDRRRHGQSVQRRLPIGPLLATGGPLREVTNSAIYRWERRGWLTDRQADHAANRLGMHPAEIWGDWYEVTA